MKKILCIFVLTFSSLLIPLFGNEIVYTEGEVTLKKADDSWEEAEIGDSVQSGDTIITEFNGFVEIQTENSLLKINPDTVFAFNEAQIGGEKRNTLTCITGSALFKIDTLLGSGPYINTMSAHAGVRGTEFTLFAAPDGSSLISVTEGIVLVSSGQGTVELREAEGVEVQPGEAPGKKFPVLRGQLDFRDWNNKQLQSFLADPVVAVYRLQGRLETFAAEIDAINKVLEINKEELTYKREKLTELKNKDDLTSAQEYYKTDILPLEVESSNQVLTIRYYALSGLSLRRYLLSRLYLLMKIEYLGNYSDLLYKDYLYAHEQSLNFYEKKIIPFLVDADI